MNHQDWQTRTRQLNGQVAAITGRDLKLWLFTFIVVLVLATGVLLLGFSNLLWTQASHSALELVAGLVLLVVIFAGYVDITVDPDDAAITGTIINMAKSLNLKVIAEGVENAEQMLFLQEHDCDEVQGYYFSRPLAVDDFSEKVRSTLLLQSDLQATTAADNH